MSDRNESEDEKATKVALKSIVDNLIQEDSTAREEHLRVIRKHDLFWEGFQDLWWNGTDRGWWTVADAAESNLISQADMEDYDKNVNIYRAHGESIIAASSMDIPKTKFPPMDADNPADVLTSKECDKIAQLIEHQNQARMAIRRAFFTLWRQHLAAAYIYSHEDLKYGEYKRPVMGMKDVSVEKYSCPNCGSELQPIEGMKEGRFYCDQCDAMVPEPNTEQTTEQEYGEIDVEILPKRKICIKVFGNKEVRVPSWARTLEDCPYLFFEEELHYSVLMDMYPEAEEIISKMGGPISFEQWARSPILTDDGPKKQWMTHRLAWLRPCAYNIFPDMRKQLRKKYPDGVCVIMVGNDVIKCIPSKMEEHWDLTQSTLSDHIHALPIGAPLVPIQEMENDMIQMILETIKHQVNETFVNPRALDLKTYGKVEIAPGMFSSATPRPGMGLDSEFYQTKTTTLSQEVTQFQVTLDGAGQFVVGSMPSIWGGPNDKGSKTYGEYESSAQRALQRLGLNVEMVHLWWPRVISKAVALFRKTMKENETMVVPFGEKGFKNVRILKENLVGEVGEVLPEGTTAYPETWGQRRATVFELMDRQVPEISATLFHPENSTFMKEVMGVRNLTIPGEPDRQKQLIEIAQLLREPPQQSDNPMMPGQMIPQPSVLTDPGIDDDQIHIETIRAWAVSEDGMALKYENPEGYQNVMLHKAAHEQNLAQQQMQQAPPPDQGGDQGGGDEEKVEPPPPENG